MSNGGNAFPTPIAVGPAGDLYASPNAEFGSSGMTLRDYFAAQALPAVIRDVASTDWDETGCAQIAYGFADAMLAERALSKSQQSVSEPGA